MGKFHIPTMICVVKPRAHSSPLERLITSLIDALPETQTASSMMGYKSQCFGPLGRNSMPCFRGEGRLSADRRPWIHMFNFGNFNPWEITVNIESGHVILHARHEEKKGDNFDITEKKRSIKLPKGVDQGRVNCFLGRDGRVLIKAPFTEAEKVKSDEIATEKSNGGNVPRSQLPHSSKSIIYPAVDGTVNQESEKDKTYPAYTPDVEITEPMNSPVSNAPSEDTDDTRNVEYIPDDTKTASYMSRVDTDAESKPDEKFRLAEFMVDKEPEIAPFLGRGGNPSKDDVDTVTSISENVSAASEPTSLVSNASSEEFTMIDKTSLDNENTVQKNWEEPNVRKQDFREDNSLDLEPLMDSANVADDGSNKIFEVRLNLKNFEPENVSVRFVDNELFIDAQKQLGNYGVHTLQEVHRKYRVPEGGILDAAHANINDNGMVRVTVPLHNEENRSVPNEELGE